MTDEEEKDALLAKLYGHKGMNIETFKAKVLDEDSPTRLLEKQMDTIKMVLKPLMPYVKYFWEHLDDYQEMKTGSYPLLKGGSTGLMYRFAQNAQQSSVRGVQMYPFIRVRDLKLKRFMGSPYETVRRCCIYGLSIDGFDVVFLPNLKGAYSDGQLIAFIPHEVMATRQRERWIHVNWEEIVALSKGEVPKTVKFKTKLMVKGEQKWEKENLQKKK